MQQIARWDGAEEVGFAFHRGGAFGGADVHESPKPAEMIGQAHHRPTMQRAVAVDQLRRGQHFSLYPIRLGGQDAQTKMIGKGGLDAQQGVVEGHGALRLAARKADAPRAKADFGISPFLVLLGRRWFR